MRYITLFKLQILLLVLMLITTGWLLGASYSNYKHELEKQINIARVIQLMDYLQGGNK